MLAVDTWLRWGAAFCLTVRDSENWSSDIHLFQRADSDEWESMGRGGGHGGDWVDSWRPEIDQTLLLHAQSGGHDVEGSDGSDIALVAQAGFASPAVHAVVVSFDDETRKVPVWPKLNAFIILGPAGLWSLTPIDEEQSVLAPATTIHCS